LVELSLIHLMIIKLLYTKNSVSKVSYSLFQRGRMKIWVGSMSELHHLELERI